jgi:hypothetical protein
MMAQATVVRAGAASVSVLTSRASKFLLHVPIRPGTPEQKRPVQHTGLKMAAISAGRLGSSTLGSVARAQLRQSVRSFQPALQKPVCRRLSMSAQAAKQVGRRLQLRPLLAIVM